MTYLSVSRGLVQEVPGPEGNVIALYYAELSKKVYALAVELLGAEGLEKRIAICEKLAETVAQREELASMRRRLADMRGK